MIEKQQLWDSFLARWPRERLSNMTLSEYVSINDQDTFTYWLETKTRSLGSIQGNTSAKFGIYKRGSDGKEQSGIGHGEIYSWRTRYGSDEKSVFAYVKNALVTIATAAYDGNLQTIEMLDFAPLVKWKIAFLYQNQQAPVMINTFSGPMLQVLTDSTANTPYPEMYQKLINNKGQRNLLEYGKACWLEANQKKALLERKTILKHFTHIASFNEGLAHWSEDTITAFCEVISQAHELKLDIYITAMSSGGMIRIGRKDLNQKSAKEVFATFEPTLSKIKFEQRFLNRDNYLCSDVTSELLSDLLESKDFVNFSNQYPITRKPLWPNDYSDEYINESIDGSDISDEIQQPKRIYNMVNTSLNQIFYGPPGTGKTYHTVEAAVKAAEPKFKWHNRDELKAEYDRLVAEKRIRFVTFHQSYGYEEFVEGLKAKTTDDKSIEYVIENGVFQNICEDAIQSGVNTPSEINPNGRVWKISLEGAHQNATKSYCLEHNLAAIGWGDSGDLNQALHNEYFDALGKNDKGTLIYFNQDMNIGDLLVCINSKTSIEAVGVVVGEYQFVAEGLPTNEDYCHQRKVKWLCKDISIDLKKLNDDTSFDLKTCTPLNRISVTNLLVNLAQENVWLDESQIAVVRKNYVLIIDEINRGNISKIFGELITLIEPSKRQGQLESIELTLPYSGRLFSVPDNLYIIGTMNTADRSLALMDTALRRRFDFVEMMPDNDVLKKYGELDVKGVKIDLAKLLEQMNQRIEVLFDREHMLGHAFFIPVVELISANKHSQALSELKQVFKNKILPLLQEYFFEDWNRIRLVLGDSNKSDSNCLVKITEQSYNEIFGSDHRLGNFDTASKTYQIASFDKDDNEDGSIWDKPETYQAIYSVKNTPDTVDMTNTLESRED